jgi:serine phosphatase RsbU (regulator of sigma subunit)/anti-sigma regulatory factor (Ser/Thr protein kinase)
MTGEHCQSSRSVTLRITLSCELKEIRSATFRVSEFLTEQGLKPAEVQACELALVEACNNAVAYATEGGRQERIGIDVICDAANLEMHVRDHTGGFDWPEKAGLPEPEQERGRGLYLIQSLMDQAEYFRGSRGNCLILRKCREEPVLHLSAVPNILDQLSHQLRDSEQIISDMAEELSFCYESLSAIFRCSAELGRSHTLKDFSQRLLTDLAQITSADWFVLRLLSRDGTKLGVFTASEPDLKLPAIQLTPESAASSWELKAALSRQDVWFEGEMLDLATDPIRRVKQHATGLIHPFTLGDQLIGTVAIGKHPGHPQFTAVHANVVHTFADFLGIQIANARFQEEQVHARLVSRELEIAKNIQRSLLPKTLPQIPGWGLAGFCESAQQVGGDFYDVVKFSDTSLLLIIADVMGKGIPAALFAAILRSLVRAVPEWVNQPAHLLSRVNRLMFQELSGVDMFITAQLVFVDTAERRLVAASAGHCPLLLANHRASPVQVLSPDGLPLGIVPEATFNPHVEALSSEARILLYTDGLTEARNPDGEFFGHDRLVEWFRTSLRQAPGAEELKHQLASELGCFQSTASIQDDQTFLIMA